MLILEIAAGLWLLNAVVMTIIGFFDRADRRAAIEREWDDRAMFDCDPGVDGLIGRYR